MMTCQSRHQRSWISTEKDGFVDFNSASVQKAADACTGGIDNLRSVVGSNNASFQNYLADHPSKEGCGNDEASVD